MNLEKDNSKRTKSIPVCITASLYIIAITQVTVRRISITLHIFIKIKEGNIDALKAAKLLLENSSISKDMVLLFDEMYLLKCVEYCGGEFFGSNIHRELYKSIVRFMIIGLKENVPYVVKAAPVIFINSGLSKDELLNCLELLMTCGFNVIAVICDNHAAVSTFIKLTLYSPTPQNGQTHSHNLPTNCLSVFDHFVGMALKGLILQSGEDDESLVINFQSQKVYLFYDTVHLIKNV